MKVTFKVKTAGQFLDIFERNARRDTELIGSGIRSAETHIARHWEEFYKENNLPVEHLESVQKYHIEMMERLMILRKAHYTHLER